MCGFTGFLSAVGYVDAQKASILLRNMAEAIIHRGPDGDGYWIDNSSGIGLAHRRLSIVDLSPAGQQPMASRNGRYVIAFNGEIYNHGYLRRLLENGERAGLAWRGMSDTESLLEAFERRGVASTLPFLRECLHLQCGTAPNGF